MSDLQKVLANLGITDGLTVVLNVKPGNKLSVASRMWPVDFSGIAQDAIWDRNTTARVEWGIRHPDGRVFGLVTLKNGDQRAFWITSC